MKVEYSATIYSFLSSSLLVYICCHTITAFQESPQIPESSFFQVTTLIYYRGLVDINEYRKNQKHSKSQINLSLLVINISNNGIVITNVVKLLKEFARPLA